MKITVEDSLPRQSWQTHPRIRATVESESDELDAQAAHDLAMRALCAVSYDRETLADAAGEYCDQNARMATPGVSYSSLPTSELDDLRRVADAAKELSNNYEEAAKALTEAGVRFTNLADGIRQLAEQRNQP